MTIPMLTFLVTIFAFFCFWLIQVKTRDAGVVDIYWGPGFAVIVFIYVFLHPNMTPWLWIIAIITTAWSLRLGLHMSIRHCKSQGEDRRYALMRRNSGGSFWWSSLLKVFLLQAVIMWIIASSQHAAFSNTESSSHAINSLLFLLGLVFFVIGFSLETIADYQLFRFKRESQNAGKTMDQGLWAWSRHPNYFGEMVLWWGIGLCGFAVSSAWWSFVGPAILTFLLLRVSGVTLLEQHLLPEKEGYEAYMKNTSRFIPLPPKR